MDLEIAFNQKRDQTVAEKNSQVTSNGTRRLKMGGVQCHLEIHVFSDRPMPSLDHIKWVLYGELCF